MRRLLNDARERRDDLADLLTTVLVDNADGVVLLSEEGVVLVANPAAEELFGIPHRQLIGAPFGHPVQGASEPSMLDVRRGATHRILEMRTASTKWQGEPVMLATLRDVTARDEAEKALRNFVQMASHELRTPLTTVVGFASTMRDHWETIPDERKLHYLEVIQGQAARLGRLAEDLLRAARAEAGALLLEIETVDLLPVLQRCAEPAGIEFTLVTDQEQVLVVADEDRIEEMTINYLGNARKYGRPPIEVHVEMRPAMVEVTVVDHGRGVDRTFVTELFSRFSRERNDAVRAEDGSGLGLAIVRSMARAMGGDAWYQANPGGGSRFTFSLVRA